MSDEIETDKTLPDEVDFEQSPEQVEEPKEETFTIGESVEAKSKKKSKCRFCNNPFCRCRGSR